MYTINLFCEDHKENSDAASRTAGGHCHLCDSNITLLPFIIAHSKCRIKIVDEHQTVFDSEEYKEWTKENYIDKIVEAKRDRRW